MIEVSYTQVLEESEGESVVGRAVLSNGVRVVVENMPGERLVSAGVWVGSGSSDERVGYEGASHFLEHLYFTGTQRRTEREIVELAAGIGDTLDAFTSHEYAACYSLTRSQDLPSALDLLLDVVVSSTIRAQAVERERDKILDEILSMDVEPEDAAFRCFAEQIYQGTPLSRPIVGSAASVKSLSRDRIIAHYHQNIVEPRIVVAIAGRVAVNEAIELVAAVCNQTAEISDQCAQPEQPRLSGPVPAPTGGARVVEMSTKHAGFVLGKPGYSRTDNRRFAAALVNAALGGTMYSRLFQEIRTKRGLAFTVYSFASLHAAAGQFGIFSQCLPEKIDDVLEICHDQLDKIQAAGITAEELDAAKSTVKGSILLGLEDVQSRMSRLAKSELCYPSLDPLDNVLAEIDSVTLDQANQVAARLLGKPLVLSISGPFWGKDFSAFVC